MTSMVRVVWGGVFKNNEFDYCPPPHFSCTVLMTFTANYNDLTSPRHTHTFALTIPVAFMAPSPPPSSPAYGDSDDGDDGGEDDDCYDRLAEARNITYQQATVHPSYRTLFTHPVQGLVAQ